MNRPPDDGLRARIIRSGLQQILYVGKFTASPVMAPGPDPPERHANQTMIEKSAQDARQHAQATTTGYRSDADHRSTLFHVPPDNHDSEITFTNTIRVS